MGGRSRRSKKRFAASSRSTRRRKRKTPSLSFFVDECVAQRHVPDVLREAGHTVYLQRELYPTGTLDVEWLPRVGAEKWILITKDENIRKRPIEVRALIGAKVKAFVMTAAGEMKGEDQGRLIARALPRIARIAGETRPPFVANITASGHVALLDTPKYR